MIDLSRHIEFLLLRHDCVIVPGWGALLCQYVGASRCDVTGQMMPPSRVITFNPALDHNDGLLVNSVMRRHGLGYDAAMKAVGDEVDTMRHQLSAQGEVGLGRIGYFRQSDNGTTPLFTQLDGGLATARYSSLPALRLKPVIEMARQEAETSDVDNEKIIKVSLGHRVLRIAASIAVILGLGIALSTPIVHSLDTDINYASVSTPAKSVEKTVAQPTFTEPANVDLNIAEPAQAEGTGLIDTVFRSRYQRDVQIMNEIAEKRRLKKEARLKAAEEARLALEAKQKANAAQKAVTTASGSNDAYCLIISSHSSRGEAKRFIARHGGQSTMKILAQDGRYRVYVASSNSQAEINALKAKVGKKYPGAWTCARK